MSPGGAAGSSVEVRRLRKAVAALAERNAALAQAAAVQDAQRRVAEERAALLEELDRLKDEFVTTASHDLKSPLTVIRGSTQLLLRRLQGPAPDLGRVAQAVAAIDAQAQAMARLLDDLLDASRLQAGSFVPRTAPVELGECLATVLARLSPEQRRRVDVALPDAPLAGEWEQARVEQVLANLIGNALKYSSAGGRVRVTVTRHAGDQPGQHGEPSASGEPGEPGARGARGEIEVAVGDDGMGIPPDELPRLFARFYRTPQAHASGLTGTGLGLYICRGIVVEHGGRIWAESAGVGRGTTFHFTLPDRPPPAGRAGRHGAAGARRRPHGARR